MVDVRQSDLKTFARCPTQWEYENVHNLPREQGGASVFGTVMHHVVLVLERDRDVEAAVALFHLMWANPADPVTGVGAEGRIDYWERGQSWAKCLEEGERIVRNWWAVIEWDSDQVLGRELPFRVPVGLNGNHLTGTIDKLVVRYIPKIDERVLMVVDYKTAKKRPTYDYLADDLQFSAYALATTRPELWMGVPSGEKLYFETKAMRRYGEWIHLKGPVMRLDAGERTALHMSRLAKAVDSFVRTREAGIFVPNISGETCKFCAFRGNCGLPPAPEDPPFYH